MEEIENKNKYIMLIFWSVIFRWLVFSIVSNLILKDFVSYIQSFYPDNSAIIVFIIRMLVHTTIGFFVLRYVFNQKFNGVGMVFICKQTNKMHSERKYISRVCWSVIWKWILLSTISGFLLYDFESYLTLNFPNQNNILILFIRIFLNSIIGLLVLKFVLNQHFGNFRIAFVTK